MTNAPLVKLGKLDIAVGVSPDGSVVIRRRRLAYTDAIAADGQSVNEAAVLSAATEVARLTAGEAIEGVDLLPLSAFPEF